MNLAKLKTRMGELQVGSNEWWDALNEIRSLENKSKLPESRDFSGVFTEEQKKDNLRLAVQALRDNPKKAKRVMKDIHGGRCCLCVMSHTAEDILGLPRDFLCGAALPTFELHQVFALRSKGSYRQFSLDYREQPHSKLYTVDVSVLNDGEDLSHKAIADLIEKQYL